MFMDPELQTIVDSLGQRIQRGVTLNDAELHLISYSARADDQFDPVAIASILTRATPANAKEWLLGHGILKASSPVRIPANSDLEMAARICVPLRTCQTLLGFLWIPDSDPPSGDEAIEVAVGAADSAAAVLYRRQLQSPSYREREFVLTHQLLAGDREIRAAAVASLEAEGLLRHSGPVAVMVVRGCGATEETSRDIQEATIRRALDQFQRSLGPHNCLAVPRGDHGVAIVAADEPALRISGPVALASRLIETVEATMSGDETWVGGCSVSPKSPLDAWAGYREALDAALVARLIPGFSPVAAWAELGPYRYLARLADVTTGEIPESVKRLLELSPDGELAETLECYLDFAGDIKSTASAMALHRASLYYRLEKIEKVTEKDLKCGDDRLELQLGLKMARMLSAYPVEPARTRSARGDGSSRPTSRLRVQIGSGRNPRPVAASA